MKTTSQFVLIYFLSILSFNSYLYASNINTIHALIETPQVKIDGNADDPAIWINKADIKNSIVFGTDKYNGIYSYNLDGNILGFS